MVVWFSLVIIVFSIKIIIGPLNTKSKKKNFLIISGIVISLIMGIRYPDYETVYDLSVYYNFYNEMIITPWGKIFTIDRFEPGYVIVNKIAATLVPWPQFILFLVAGFVVFSTLKYIYENSSFPFEATLFYITLGMMAFQLTAFRQSIAIGICLLSVSSISKRNLPRFIAHIALAMTFHKMSFVFIPMYFLATRKDTLKFRFILFSSFILLIVFADGLVRLGNQFLESSYTGYSGSIFAGIIPILVYTFALVFTSSNKKSNSFLINFNLLIIGVGLYALRYNVQVLERISFYFTPAVIIILPKAIYSIKGESSKKLVWLMIVVFSIALYLYRVSYSDYGDFRFFWSTINV